MTNLIYRSIFLGALPYRAHFVSEGKKKEYLKEIDLTTLKWMGRLYLKWV